MRSDDNSRHEEFMRQQDREAQATDTEKKVKSDLQKYKDAAAAARAEGLAHLYRQEESEIKHHKQRMGYKNVHDKQAQQGSKSLKEAMDRQTRDGPHWWPEGAPGQK